MRRTGWSGRYIYALDYRCLNRLYDPLIHLTMGKQRFKQDLVLEARLQPAMRVLDVGCGTGTLLMLLSRAGAQAAGVDGDMNILDIARSKRARSDASFALVAGLSEALPFPNSVFDRVFSTWMLHHLDDSTNIATLREVRRVLRPRGELHVADWDHRTLP